MDTPELPGYLRSINPRIGQEVWVRTPDVNEGFKFQKNPSSGASTILSRMPRDKGVPNTNPYELGKIVEVAEGEDTYAVDIPGRGRVEVKWMDCENHVPADAVNNRDLVALQLTNLPVVLDCIRQRYETGLAYTHVGPLLLAVHNTSKNMLFDEAIASFFRQPPTEVRLPGTGLAQPHIFNSCRQVWHHFCDDPKPRMFVFSGESGSGKSRIAQQIFRYFAPSMHDNAPLHGMTGVIQAGWILLQAFGSATVPANQSSSRFASLTRLQINTKTGYAKYADFQVTMLETERAVTPGVNRNFGERNFNVFYQMIEGLPKSERGRLFPSYAGDPSTFNFLGSSVGFLSTDARDWQERTFPALGTIGCSVQEVNDVLRIVAAVALCGEVDFTFDSRAGADRTVQISNFSVFDAICGLLHVNTARMKDAIMFRSRKAQVGSGALETAPRERREATVDQARDALISIAKLCYEQLFYWLMRKTVVTIGGPVEEPWVGTLDVLGFEDAEVNTIDQFLGNYSNELLQQAFIDNLYVTAGNSYDQEGLERPEAVDCCTNDEVLVVLEGIISVLNTESDSTKGDDIRFSSVVCDKYKTFTNFEVLSARDAPKNSSGTRASFAVVHSSGTVQYTISQWRQRNKEAPPQAALQELQNSKNSTVRHIADAVTLKSRAAEAAHFTSAHQQGMRDFLGVLARADPIWVRCVRTQRSERATTPVEWDGNAVLAQLRHLSIFETIRLHRECHTYRKSFESFLSDYEALRCVQKQMKASPPPGTPAKTEAQSLLKIFEMHKGTHYIIGKSNVFLTQSSTHTLDAKQKEVLVVMRQIALVTQRLYRMQKSKTRFDIDHKRLIRIKSDARNYLMIRNQLRGLILTRRVFSACLVMALHPRNFSMERAASLIQRSYRGHVVRMNLTRSDMLSLLRAHLQAMRARRVLASVKSSLRQHKAVTRVASWWRGRRSRAYFKLVKERHRVAILVQKAFRGHLARRDPFARRAMEEIRKVRQHYANLRCAIVIQAAVRHLLEKQNWEDVCYAAERLQQYFHSGGSHRCLWIMKRRASIKIQAAIRGSIARMKLRLGRITALWKLEKKSANERCVQEASFISELREKQKVGSEEPLPGILNISVQLSSFGLAYPHGWVSSLAQLLGRAETVASLAVGSQHSVVACHSGAVYCWGLNNRGQLGQGLRAPAAALPPFCTRSDAVFVNLGLPQRVEIKQVACGSDHIAICTGDGQVFSWGDNKYGQCGQGWIDSGMARPGCVDFQGATITQLTLGPRHCAALSSAGSLWMWGERKAFGLPHLEAADHSFQLLVWDAHVFDIEGAHTPLRPKELPHYLGQAESMLHIDRAEAVSWPVECTRLVLANAMDMNVQQKRGTVCLMVAGTLKIIAQRGPPLSEVTTAGQGHLAVSKKGFCYGMGTVSPAIPGENFASQTFEMPTKLMAFVRCGMSVSKVTASQRHALALTTNGHVFQWGTVEYSDGFECGFTGKPLGFRDTVIEEPKFVEGGLRGSRVVQIETCNRECIVRWSGGEVYGWDFVERARDGHRLLPGLYQYRAAEFADSITAVSARSFCAVLATPFTVKEESKAAKGNGRSSPQNKSIGVWGSTSPAASGKTLSSTPSKAAPKRRVA
eukprot:gnl/MRDRNA2_/MRDRNA2_29483_c0_seq1.p1 gnl/MRDRNA2_/MRDRNA2_29483_c0~~gnl/MRDRNA2_/MRDRNA2_29483_c0_seq1.p1  ORF type:complete len:1619 (+),score=256.29 gnl/MRDRNA2_/MRDRNA2_29483_c0_seq1:121-4977(+)